jgi:hypothetical protein
MSDAMRDTQPREPERAPARTRLLALIGVTTGERRATHTTNFPLDPEKMLPEADVVLLVADDDPGAMLFRYSAFGEVGGDTWHLTLADAQSQAGEEYGEALGEWVEVPDDITDAHFYAVRYAADRLYGRDER